MNFPVVSLLLASMVAYGTTPTQKSPSATTAEVPEHFMRGVLKLAIAGGRGIDVLDGSDRVYSPDFMDAIYGEGCYTAHRVCIVDHMMWARICGCRYFPEDAGKKGDPLCGCPEKLTFSELSVVRTDDKSADVSALLNLEPHRQDKVTWHLIMTSQGWRIDEVATQDFPSLKAEMRGKARHI
jgi:hypothetical protein